MRIGLVQERQNALYDFHAESPWFTREEALGLQAEMVEQNLMLLREAADAGCDLALTSEAVNFPGKPAWHEGAQRELASVGERALLEGAAAIAREAGMFVVVGAVCASDGEHGLANEAVAFDRHGAEVMRYRKQFLAGDEAEWLDRGEGFPVWESEFGRIGIGICWDLQFPETCRAYARQGCDLVLSPTWGWESYYGAARAYENGTYVAAAMAVPYGHDLDGERRWPSMLVGPDGKSVARGPLDGPALVVAEVRDVRDCASTRELRMGCLSRWERGE